MLDKEVKRNPALAAMLGGADTDKSEKAPKVVKEKKVHDPRKANPRAYERNRGRGGAKPMSYYLPPDLIKLLNIKAAQEDKTKSELVIEGLRWVLHEELKEANRKAKTESVGETA